MSGIPCGRGCPCERRRKIQALNSDLKYKYNLGNDSDSSICSPEKLASSPGMPATTYSLPSLPFKPRLDSLPTVHVRPRPARLAVSPGNPYAQFMRNASNTFAQSRPNAGPLQYKVQRTERPPGYYASQRAVIAQPKAVRPPAVAWNEAGSMFSTNQGSHHSSQHRF